MVGLISTVARVARARARCALLRARARARAKKAARLAAAAGADWLTSLKFWFDKKAARLQRARARARWRRWWVQAQCARASGKA